MATRRQYIEQIRRLIYNGQPDDDATITIGLVNVVLNQAIGVAAQKNYQDSLQLDGIAYINNSFYTTYKGLAITSDEQFLWKIQLPHIPIGVGDIDGVETCVLYDGVQNSYPIVLLNVQQKGYQRGMRAIPNKLLGYYENQYLFILSTLFLYQFTAKVTMVSGGLSSDLSSTLNVPDNYFPIMNDFLLKYFVTERTQPLDSTNDGVDFITTT